MTKSTPSRATANQIYDSSDKSSGSHFDNLSEDVKFFYEELNTKKFSVDSTVDKKISVIMKSSDSLDVKLSRIEKVKVGSNVERGQKEIFRFM